MSKENTAGGVSAGTFNSLMNDADMPKRVNSYKDSLKALNHSPSEEKIQHLTGTLSVIEGLGSKVIRENLKNPQEFNKLIDTFHQNAEECFKLTNDPKQIKDLKVNVAKTEAALKGFVLPLSISGPANELNWHGIDKSELLVPMKATEQALLELANKNIPKAEFAEKVTKRAQEILASSPENYSPDKLKQFEQFIAQGTQKQKPSKLNPDQQEKLAEAASKAVNSLTETMKKDTEEIKKNPTIQADATIQKAKFQTGLVIEQSIA